MSSASMFEWYIMNVGNTENFVFINENKLIVYNQNYEDLSV